MDIAAAVGFDRTQFLKNCHSVNPGLSIIELSARTGEGVPAWLGWLENKIPV
jgi:hydrogenase nickel incorporation protein HypB